MALTELFPELPPELLAGYENWNAPEKFWPSSVYHDEPFDKIYSRDERCVMLFNSLIRDKHWSDVTLSELNVDHLMLLVKGLSGSAYIFVFPAILEGVRKGDLSAEHLEVYLAKEHVYLDLDKHVVGVICASLFYALLMFESHNYAVFQQLLNFLLLLEENWHYESLGTLRNEITIGRGKWVPSWYLITIAAVAFGLVDKPNSYDPTKLRKWVATRILRFQLEQAPYVNAWNAGMVCSGKSIHRHSWYSLVVRSLCSDIKDLKTDLSIVGSWRNYCPVYHRRVYENPLVASLIMISIPKQFEIPKCQQ